MFDFFSGSHILILLAVMLVVVGPKDLPRLMNIMGQWAGKARRMANEFKKSFDDMARQEELDKLRLELDELRKTNLDVPEAAQTVAETSAPPAETAPEPRSGEFQINETPPPGNSSSTENASAHPNESHAPKEPAAGGAGSPVP